MSIDSYLYNQNKLIRPHEVKEKSLYKMKFREKLFPLRHK